MGVDIVQEKAGRRRVVLSGLVWMYLSALVGGVSRLVVLAILARLLSPRDFGLMGIALICTSMAERLGQVGVGPALVQRESIDADDVVTGAVLSALCGLVMMTVLWLLAPFVAALFREPLVSPLVRVLSLAFFIDGLAVTSDALLQRSLGFRSMMVVENASYLLGIGVVGAGLAMLGLGVWALVAAHVAMRTLRTGLLYWIAPSVPGSGSFNRARVRGLLYMGGGFSLGRILNFASLQGDNFVVGRVLGMEALGFYSRAYQLMALPAVYVAQVIERVLFPVMSKEQGHPERLREAFLSVLELLTLVSLPTGVFLFFTAPEIVEVLFGSRWSSVVPVLSVLSFGVFFRTAYKCSDTVARSVGAVYRYALQQGVYAVGILLGSLVGAYVAGTKGVAVGVVAAVALNYLLMTRLSAQLLMISFGDLLRGHLSGVFVSLCVAGAVLLARSIARGESLSSLQQLLLMASVASVAWALSVCVAARLFPGRALQAVFTRIPALSRWRLKRADVVAAHGS